MEEPITVCGKGRPTNPHDTFTRRNPSQFKITEAGARERLHRRQPTQQNEKLEEHLTGQQGRDRGRSQGRRLLEVLGVPEVLGIPGLLGLALELGDGNGDEDQKKRQRGGQKRSGGHRGVPKTASGFSVLEFRTFGMKRQQQMQYEHHYLASH